MNTFKLSLVFALLLFISCKSSEEVIQVNDNPFALTETVIQEDTVSTENPDDFIQLNIGHVNPILTLDPLFAFSQSEWNAIQFIFEGLTRLNKDNGVEPALARSWVFSEDSTAITFNLRSNVYYQDSRVFSSGIGRKFIANDVLNAFKRMADVEVPATAANQFFNIVGFESYFMEQHYVLLPSERALNEIGGITISNDSTITFQLEENDPDFLHKLAQPWAVIYPREAVNAEMILTTYVGTGPYYFVKNENQNRIVLGKNRDYREEYTTNRIDIIHGNSEAELYQKIARSEIDVIPILSPEIMKTVLNPDLSLNPIYSDRFELFPSDATLDYSIYFNPESFVDKEALAQTILNRSPFSDSMLQIYVNATGNGSEISSEQIIYTTETDDPFVKHVYLSIQRSLGSELKQLKLTNIRIPFPSITLYSSDFPYKSNEPFITLKSPVFYLSDKKFTGFNLNSSPWWLDVKALELTGVNN